MINSKKKGFTLIELLLVVAILGILAGIVLMLINPTRSQQRARDGVVKSQLSKLALVANTARAASDDGCYESNLQTSSFIERWPNGNPTSSTTYTYTRDSCSAFHIVAASFNGTVTNWCMSEATKEPTAAADC